MTKHGCLSKATATGLLLSCAVVVLSAGPAPADALRRGARRFHLPDDQATAGTS
jgi:hypothetical protein